MRSFCARPMPRVRSRRELEPLRFAAAQGRTRLAEFQIAKPGIDQQRKRPRDFLDVAPKNSAASSIVISITSPIDLFVIENFERLRVVTFPAAIFTRHITARQKTHLQLDHALAFARFAAAAFGVERKPARGITAHTRNRQLRIKIPDFVEDFDVSRRRRARSFPDRRLIDFVNRFDARRAADRA